MTLFIKNMVCNRCILAVENVLKQNSVEYISVRLGEVGLNEKLAAHQLKSVEEDLKKLGFELLDDQKQKVIERIKTIIIELVHHGSDDNRYKLSELLSSSLHKDYSYLSHLFSEVEGTTIEKFLIHQKIEKAKELLVYNEMNLSEIAYHLGYSSVAHLSAQFKQVTGLTPTHFKNLGAQHRKPIDKLG